MLGLTLDLVRSHSVHSLKKKQRERTEMAGAHFPSMSIPPTLGTYGNGREQTDCPPLADHHVTPPLTRNGGQL